MESFKIELVSNAPVQLSPANTLSSFTKFYQSNWIWKVNKRLQFRKNPTHQCTKLPERENLCFLTWKVPSPQSSTIWNLVFTFPLRILLKPWTLSFRKDTITAITASQLKCLEECKKLRFTLQMKDLVLHSLVRIWDTFSEVMLVKNLEKCWEEKGLTNQNTLTTFSAYTLSWYTQTWSSTLSSATRRLQFCIAFLLFRSSRLETFILLDSTWTIRHLATCNSDHCSNFSFIVFTLTWEIRAVKKNTFCIYRYHSFCFDVQKNLQYSFLA